MELTAWNVFLAILVAFTVSRVQKLYNGLRATGNIPSLKIPFQPYAFPGGLFSTSWWNFGIAGVWLWRHTLYKRFGSDTISIVPFISGNPAIITSNLEVARQIKGGLGKTAFGKMPVKGQPTGYFGTNLLLAESEVWRKHRRIVGPAFSQQLYDLVWTNSLDLYAQMLQKENPSNLTTFTVPRVQEITFKFAFYIIGRCGFDFPFNWVRGGERVEKPTSEEGKGLGKGEGKEVVSDRQFSDAMRYFLDNIKLVTIPDGMREVVINLFNKEMNTAISTIRAFMETKIGEKESQIKSGNSSSLGSDIFSMLVSANLAEEDAKLKLDYDELISDVFLMLFAGHETTAHTLAATIACLARYPEQQQEVVDQILEAIGDREPTIDDYPNLNKVQAAFYESLRMFPTAFISIREAKEDTVLYAPISLDSDECTAVPVAKGTQMVVDMIGIHYNPRYYEDPDTYKISRWKDISNESEAIPAFGFGPRACIGRKFALTEVVCFLTMLLRDYKIEPILVKGENVDEWFENVKKCSLFLALGVDDVGVRFVKR